MSKTIQAACSRGKKARCWWGVSACAGAGVSVQSKKRNAAGNVNVHWLKLEWGMKNTGVRIQKTECRRQIADRTAVSNQRSADSC